MTESKLFSQSFESLKTTLASPESVIQAGNTKLAADISSCYFDRGVQNGALWSAVLDAAIRIPSDHPAQTSLANAVRELYNSKKTSKTREWDWDVLPSLGKAINPIYFRIDMFRPELGTGASRSSPEFKMMATNNFNAFVDKLTTESTSVLALAPAVRPPFDLRLAISDLRAAFEEPYDTGTSTGTEPEESFESRVLKACRWLTGYPNPLFEKMRAGDSTGLPDDADTLEDLRLGSLCATQGKYSIPQRKHAKPGAFSAVSRDRWHYWAARIHEFTMSPYRPQLSAETARQMNLAAEAMEKAQWRPWEMYIPGK